MMESKVDGYIYRELEKGIQKETIKEVLLRAGYDASDIDKRLYATAVAYKAAKDEAGMNHARTKLRAIMTAGIFFMILLFTFLFLLFIQSDGRSAPWGDGLDSTGDAPLYEVNTDIEVKVTPIVYAKPHKTRFQKQEAVREAFAGSSYTFSEVKEHVDSDRLKIYDECMDAQRALVEAIITGDSALCEGAKEYDTAYGEDIYTECVSILAIIEMVRMEESAFCDSIKDDEMKILCQAIAAPDKETCISNRANNGEYTETEWDHFCSAINNNELSNEEVGMRVGSLIAIIQAVRSEDPAYCPDQETQERGICLAVLEKEKEPYLQRYAKQSCSYHIYRDFIVRNKITDHSICEKGIFNENLDTQDIYSSCMEFIGVAKTYYDGDTSRCTGLEATLQEECLDQPAQKEEDLFQEAVRKAIAEQDITRCDDLGAQSYLCREEVISRNDLSILRRAMTEMPDASICEDILTSDIRLACLGVIGKDPMQCRNIIDDEIRLECALFLKYEIRSTALCDTFSGDFLEECLES